MKTRGMLACVLVAGLAVAVQTCGGGSATTTPSSAAGIRPNFVVIVVDDMAYGLLGSARRFPFLQLPNLDRLSARGTRFDNAFVTTSLCSPSRGSILSGLYAHTHGVLRNDNTDLSSSIVTYPMLMRQQGYKTAFIGKWHMNGATDAPRPGFDYWLSFAGQGVYQDQLLNENGRAVQSSGYITDVLTNYAVNWLHQVGTQPFAMILSHKAPHEPFTPAPRDAAALPGAALPEPPSFLDTFKDKPSYQRRYVPCGGSSTAFTQCPDPLPAELPQWPWAPTLEWRLDYMRTLLAVDASVGSVLAAIDAQGLTPTTYVVFMSDNGLFLGEHRLGDKRLMYEDSIRIPFVIAGPEAQSHQVSSLALNLDVAPTLLDLAGIAVPVNMQGHSLAKVLRNQAAGVRDSFLYEYFAETSIPVVPDILGIRTDRYSYVTYPGSLSDEELYDLSTDGNEMVNVAAHPEVAATRADLRQQLNRLLDQTNAPAPTSSR